MTKENREFATIAAMIFPFAALYFAGLPSFVQGGDTAEMVSAARHLFVPHPPGYPLWVWLENLWMRVIPAGSAFWRASFFSAVLALNALALFIWPLRASAMKSLIVLPLVALSPAFIEAAILPDVFALHALFTVAIVSLYLSDPSPRRTMAIPFLFALSLANHHTAIFLVPLLIALGWEDPRQRKPFLLSLGAGVLATAVLYASLLAMNVDSPFSWARLSSLGDLVSHLLRTDYGTFRLQAQDHAGGFGPLKHFLTFSLMGWIPVLAFIGYLLYTNRRSSKPLKLWVLGVSTAASVGFFLLSNVPADGTGAEILTRFHVMPLILIAMIVREILARAPQKRALWIGALASLTFVLPAMTRLGSYVSLRADSVIEDYARNFLVEANERKPALILAESDSAYFAMRYLQAEAPDPSGIAVVRKTLFFHDWYAPKIKSLVPEFSLPAAESIVSTRRMNLQSDLIDPNIERLTILIPSGFQDGQTYRVKFLGLGRQLLSGKGVSIDEPSLHEIALRTQYEAPAQGPQAFTRTWLYSQYSYVYMMAKAWNRALEIVPYAYPALENLCHQDGTDPRCAEDFRESVRLQSLGLF